MSPAQPSTAIAVRNDSDLATLDDSPEWRNLWARANVMCRSGLVPRALQGKPADTMAVLLACNDLGLAANVTNLNQFHVIEGAPEPSAQLTLGLSHAAGYETRWGRNDSEVAELDIRRPGADRWEHFAFTIDDARRAHLLDEWVERWARVDERNQLQKYVIGCGKPTPDWATKLIDAGEVKHKDNWFNYPADMLRARVAKRAVKAAAPEVRLGLVDQIQVRVPMGNARPQVVVVDHDETDPFDISDAEIVTDFGDFEPVAVTETATETATEAVTEKATEPEMVPVATAKAEVVKAGTDAGLTELQAQALGSQLWVFYRLPAKGSVEPIERKALNIVLTDMRAAASAMAVQPDVPPVTLPSGPAMAGDTTEARTLLAETESLFGGTDGA